MEKTNENRRADLIADRRKRCEEFANGVIDAFWACKDSNELRDCVYTLIYAELLRERRAVVADTCDWLAETLYLPFGTFSEIVDDYRDAMKANEI